MSTQDIANQLVAFCRQGKFEEAQTQLFAPDAISLEPEDTPMAPRETRGLPAIIAKGKAFTSMLEKVHTMKVSDPIVSEESFACIMSLDATMKGRGRTAITELCVYLVKDGKIACEAFHP